MNTTVTQERYSMDICELLQTLSLGGVKHNREAGNNVSPPKEPTNFQADIAMFDDPNYQSDAAESDCSNTSTRRERYGCAYLRAIQAQLDSYSTTGGEYLEAIFTHREIFSSYPSAHPDCARAFGDIAYKLEQRAWRADREADTEAVVAFRHEAWSIAAMMTYHAPPTAISRTSEPSHAILSPVCIMPPAW